MTDPKDKLMDALLREHASDEKKRERAIAAIEAAIDTEGEQEGGASSVRFLPRFAAAILFLAVVGIAGLAIYETMQPGAPVIAEHQLGATEQAMVDEVSNVMPATAPESVSAENSPTVMRMSAVEDVSEESVELPGSLVESSAQVVVEEKLERLERLELAAADTTPNVVVDAERVAPQEAPISPMPMLELDGSRRARSVVPKPSTANDGGGGSGAVPLSKDSVYFSGLPQGGVGFGALSADSAPPVDRERYGRITEQGWISVTKNPLSTFSIDVDTASYSNLRRILTEGGAVQPDAVRIEEMINYFDYDYPQPDEQPFAVQTDLMECPWNSNHHLVRIGLQGKDMPKAERPVTNLVFLIDVSGSMAEDNKLPLLRQSLLTLLEELDARDTVSIVVYAGAEGLALEPSQVNEEGREKVRLALDKLNAGGSTNGGAGIKLAYKLATENFIEGGVNRVILASDGDFNVGVTGEGELVELVKKNAKTKVFLSVLGFGGGNLNDAMMESITNDGNGNYYYIDSEREGRKVFLQNLTGTLVTIAKDVKIQVDFNPAKVQAYRLIGYSNRRLRDEDFNNDKVDAGDVGAGHSVTALYEVVPHGVHVPDVGQVTPSEYVQPAPGTEVTNADTRVDEQLLTSQNWLTVRLRHKKPEGEKSELQKFPLAGEPVELSKASGDFKFAAGVALFGMKLRDSEYIGDADWLLVEQLIKDDGQNDPHGYRAELRQLVEIAKQRED